MGNGGSQREQEGLRIADRAETWLSVCEDSGSFPCPLCACGTSVAHAPLVCWLLPRPLTRPCSVQTYEVQGSLQEDSRVTVSIVLENQSSSFLKNMELNVLDSLNTKLARPEGSSVHDGVPVPFQLPPGEAATALTSRARRLRLPVD